ncbi:interleukin-20 receptor subunit beta-like [Anguilla rostrata]|uniref:interleukin-20 receptor subunit beta-like n=1 Tax=Anguilla rostrata TaxID=7938 RepID=UPI0030D3E470
MYFKETINILIVLQVISKVGLSQLPSPQYVRVASENLRNVLLWSSVPENSAVEYAVQYCFDALLGWKNVSSCTPTNVTHCDITSVAGPPVRLTLRVRAESANQTSAWSTSKPFCATEETRLGPPGVTLFPISSGLLVQITDPSPQLRAEFEDELQYVVVFWEQAAGRKESRKGLSSSVRLESLKAGGNYCVQVQYALIRRKGNLSVPVCMAVPESEDSYSRTMWIVVVVMVLLAVLICACLIGIYKNYNILKKALQPTIGLPDHILRFFEGEEFGQQLQTNASSPDSEESMVCVIEDDMGEEESSHPIYDSSSLKSAAVNHFPACTSRDLANSPSAPRDQRF